MTFLYEYNASTSRVCPIQLLVSLYLGQINYFPIRFRERGRMTELVKELRSIGTNKEETKNEKMEYHPYKDETEMRNGS